MGDSFERFRSVIDDLFDPFDDCVMNDRFFVFGRFVILPDLYVPCCQGGPCNRPAAILNMYFPLQVRLDKDVIIVDPVFVFGGFQSLVVDLLRFDDGQAELTIFQLFDQEVEADIGEPVEPEATADIGVGTGEPDLGDPLVFVHQGRKKGGSLVVQRNHVQCLGDMGRDGAVFEDHIRDRPLVIIQVGDADRSDGVENADEADHPLARHTFRQVVVDHGCEAAGQGRSAAESEQKDPVSSFVYLAQVPAGRLDDPADVQISRGKGGIENLLNPVAVGADPRVIEAVLSFIERFVVQGAAEHGVQFQNVGNALVLDFAEPEPFPFLFRVAGVVAGSVKTDNDIFRRHIVPLAPLVFLADKAVRPSCGANLMVLLLLAHSWDLSSTI